jgi:hypothetical protein
MDFSTELSIRVGTVNVHGWETCWIPNVQSEPNHETLARYILDWTDSTSALHFLAVEEVASAEKLSIFARILDFPYFVCSGEGEAAVGFMSKFPIEFSHSVQLEPGSVDSRYLLFVVVKVPFHCANGYVFTFSICLYVYLLVKQGNWN